MPRERPSWVARLECCHDVGAHPSEGGRPAPDAGDDLYCPECRRFLRVVDVVLASWQRDPAGRF